jgi:polysaccharide biosynthesis protein PslH
MRAFEKKALAMFDHVAAVSEQDADTMRSWFGARSVSTIPNGVDVKFYENVGRTERLDRILYCASMDSYVNQDAVMYFIKQVLPIIWQKRPGLQFMILGSKPPAFITALASDRIIVTGSVPDVRPLLDQASACVVPLRIAGGSRLKILEALAAGLPVISTSIGAEGLDVEPGKHLLIADQEAAFAEATIRLLEDRSLQQSLRESGRRLVHERYDWRMIVPKVEQAWEQAIANHRDRLENRVAALSELCPQPASHG